MPHTQTREQMLRKLIAMRTRQLGLRNASQDDLAIGTHSYKAILRDNTNDGHVKNAELAEATRQRTRENAALTSASLKIIRGL